MTLRITLILLAVFVTTVSGVTNSDKDSSRKVFFDARTRQTRYAGPGRQNLPPANVKEVLIGYFGPDKPSDPEGDDMYHAACLAIEQANQVGGYNGVPFRLVQGWSDNRWQSGAAEVVRMAYTHKVWAIVGGIDGPSTHVAEQVVAKARLALLSPGSTDKTVNLANVPWMFSCLPGDHLQVPVLAQAIAAHAGKNPFLLVSSVDHDSHLLTVELNKSFVQRRMAPRYHFEFKPGRKDYSRLAEKIVQAEAHTLVLIAAAEESAQLICAVREKGFEGSVFGGPHMGSRSFLEKAGKTAEGVIFPLLYTPGKESGSFEEEFACRSGNRPDYLAAHTYDSVSLLIAAIRKAGLNRPRICDAVRELSPWPGVTGSIRWDSLGGNSRAVGLGTVRAGRVICVSMPQT
ncbi:MAG: ABC transporter substrate-binding protein, partial [Planctomycetota bacterium]